MHQEPQVGCDHCRARYSLEEGAKLGMQCFRCGGILVLADGEWAAQELLGANGKTQKWNTGTRNIRVAEFQLPAHNEVDEEAVGQFITSLPLPLALEYFGKGDRRVMLVRGPEDSLRYMAGKIQTLWPSAVLQLLEEDPLNNTNGNDREYRYNFSFKLGQEPYLPIRTWTSFLRGDPVNTLLATILGLGAEESLWLQLIIGKKGKPNWLESVQRRLKIEAQRGYMVNPGGGTATQTETYTHAPVPQSMNILKGFTFLLVLLFAMGSVVFAMKNDWLLFAAYSLVVVVAGGALLRFVNKDTDPWRGADLSLVGQKVVHQDTFYLVYIRACVKAATHQKARGLAERLESALSQYSLAGGNNFEIAPDPGFGGGAWLTSLDEEKDCMWLGPDEVAGLWHPPIVNDQVSPGLVPVRGVEIRSPDPQDVRGFYRIGKYFTTDGGQKPVHISSAAMKHNLFCIGKPGTGKSTLMLHLSLAGLMDEERPAVIVVDPHGDLVNRLLGSIRPEDTSRVRILDVGDKEFILTFNPLDVNREGWGVVEVTNSVVDIGKSLWSDYWGPRMQIPLKRGVQLLAAANEMRPRNECLGLSQLASILNTQADIRKNFIKTELEGSPHRTVLERYFLEELDTLTNHFKEQIIQPVLSKAYRFEEDPMLSLFSCPEAKLDLAEVINERQLLVINTGMSHYGAEISNFVGSLIINVMLRELVRRGEQSPDSRVPVMVVIDEFQTFTGVPWSELIQQMRKYGGRMVLGTQSMASLRMQDRDIPEVILSGVYSMFAFNMNGDDAEYFSRLELSGDRGGPSADTLISLEPYKAYVRLEREDGRLSRPFYFESEKPPEQDVFLYERVKKLRAEYSLPYEEARQKAVDMLEYLNQYRSTMLNERPRKKRTRSRDQSSDEAAVVLLNKASEEISQSTSAVIDGALDMEIEPPWRVETDADGNIEEVDPSDEAGAAILGKGILDGWNDITFEDEEDE